MKIKEALALATSLLKSNQNAGASDALLLMMQVTSLSKERVVFGGDVVLNDDQINNFFHLIKRRASGEPISHLLQRREFYGSQFLVTKDVLDPRSDSEVLIEAVFDKFSDKNATIKILELGSGSGCLVITLLKYYPNAVATTVDLSLEALNICQKNAQDHEVLSRLTLLNSDMFDEIDRGSTFDLIISNPPYIRSGDIESLQSEVKLYEPRMALDGGEDGLKFYRIIAQQARNHVISGASVVVEIGYDQAEDVSKIFCDVGYDIVEIRKDLGGNDRVVVLIKNRECF